MFDAINEFVDIQNSTAQKLNIDSWRDIKNKTVLFTQDGKVLAVYSDGKFMYNPKKLKISDAQNYDLYEIVVGGVNVQNRRDQRSYNRQGLVSTKDVDYVGTPKSTQYIWDKDWNPEVNKVYYSKLLQRQRLGKYSKTLEDAYDTVIQLIDQRKTRLTGKRTMYDRMITQISTQITKIEDLMVGLEKDVAVDLDKLQKELKKLPGIIQKANEFMASEAKEYSQWGRRQPIPLTPIER